ncbi:conserved hypothetical protein [Rhodococcus phage E3]|uniref:polynucleotide kinase n=1 Tax=Rhodococcus phage E3 TaxID=1007869 RepID=UPI0002C6B1F0|nr:polynucleotide kinase [Rhodococcus phage E3]AEQ20918.1 conserved hypothetical protein [Rhodococcus phage E3]
MTDTKTQLKTAIFDMDGTLVDVTSVRHLIFQKPRDYEGFYVGGAQCPPNKGVLAQAIDMHERGYEIIIVTGRDRKYEGLTRGWLARHFPHYTALFMREDGDRRPAHIVKEEILGALLMFGRDVVFAADDDPKIIEMWTRNGIDTMHVPGWKDR